MSSQETILVTGAGGFLGGTIVEALHFGGKYKVHAGIAHWLSAPRVARLPIQLVQCDILKPAELAEALNGVDYVIHCAVGDRNVTVDGTANLLAAAAKAGVQRVVHISTVSVYGTADGLVDETTPPTETMTEYGAIKLAAENICRETDVNVVILRPTIIYGPFSTRWTMLYAQRLKAGWRHLGSLGEGTCNLVHVHDVTRYAIAAMKQPGAIGEAFNINGPEIVTWNDYLERFNQHLGLPPRVSQAAGLTHVTVGASGAFRSVGRYVIKHHAAQLRWVAHRSDRLKATMEQAELALRLTTNQDELNLFGLDVDYLIDKAKHVFGFAPSIDVDCGLVMAVAWLNHMGEAA